MTGLEGAIIESENQNWRNESENYFDKNFANCRPRLCSSLLRAATANRNLLRLPRPAPNFIVKNLAGESVALEKFRGQVVLLDFWATWCKPCVKSMPSLQQLHERYAGKGLAVLGVSTEVEGEKKVPPFIAKHKISYPIFLDSADEPAWEKYKVKVMPMLFLINRKGQIVQQWTGEVAQQEVERTIVRIMD